MTVMRSVFLLMLLGEGEQVGDGEAAGGGDELGAEGVIGGVQREGELHVEFLIHELAELREQADGGEGDLPPAEVRGVVAGEQVDGFGDVGEVEQGFAHAHQDDGAEDPAELGGLGFEGEELLDDLAAGEVAGEALGAGGAEVAGHGAAGLGGEAAGGAVGAIVGHEDGFDLCAAGTVERSLMVPSEDSVREATWVASRGISVAMRWRSWWAMGIWSRAGWPALS